MYKNRIRVKHALTCPCTPSHALSSPRPKPTRPLPAVRPSGVLLTVDQDSDTSTYTKLA